MSATVSAKASELDEKFGISNKAKEIDEKNRNYACCVQGNGGSEQADVEGRDLDRVLWGQGVGNCNCALYPANDNEKRRVRGGRSRCKADRRLVVFSTPA